MANRKQIRLALSAAMLLLIGGIATPTLAQLDESCVINILNRTIQVQPDGSWAMPNVPSNMGQVRARANCVRDGITTSGQSDYFTLVTNGIVEAGEIRFDNVDPIPVALSFAESGAGVLNGVGSTLQLVVSARFSDNTQRDVTSASSGINYTSTNPAIASVSADGLVTAVASGVALITARKDGVVVVKQLSVVTSGDVDQDGLPDDFELANGLNPNDPIDAAEDQDSDGLSALEEYQRGTNINVADSDGDGLTDDEEVTNGADGFVTNPLARDTDSDGLSDALEGQIGSDPTDSASRNLSAAIAELSVTPALPVLVFNTMDTEASLQLRVSASLVDGSVLDLTDKVQGTSYNSSDLTIASFGLESGRVFGGQTGLAEITIANSGHATRVQMTVMTFEPKALAAIDIPGYANNVEVQGDYAYVAAGSAGLQVVDVANRAEPRIVAALDTAGTAIDVRIAGSLLYLADGAEGIQIINIADPLNPVWLGGLDTPGTAEDLQIRGSVVYVADGEAGLQIIDVTDPTLPLLIGDVGSIGNAKGVDVAGTLATVVGHYGLYLVDASIPAAPVVVGSWAAGQSRDVVTDGAFAYIAAYAAGYYVVDIREPASPKLVAGNNKDIASRDVELRDGYAFFAEQLFPNVIAYANVSDPMQSRLQGIINLSSFGDYAGTGIALDDRYAYVTEESYIVSEDFKTDGRTRLFIAQYRYGKQDAGTTAPIVSVNHGLVERNPKQGENVHVIANAEDDVGVAAVAFFVDGQYVGLDTTRPYEFVYHVDELASNVSFSAWAVDFGWNIGKSAVVNLAVDPNPRPLVTLSSPVVGQTVGEGTTLRMNATASDDDGIAQVEFLFNGEVIGRADTLPFAVDFKVPATFSVQQTVPVIARAYDSIGAVSATLAVGVIVEPDPLPTVLLSVPSPNQSWASGSLQDFKVRVADNTSVSYVEFYSEGSRFTQRYLNVASTEVTVQYFVNQWDSQRGSVRVFARAFDSIGQSVDTAEVNVVVPPNAAPTVALETPRSGSTATAGTHLRFTSNAVDDGGIRRVAYYVDNAYVGSRESPPYEFMYAIPASKADAGNIAIKVCAYDRLWVGGCSTNEAIVNITPSQLPSVSISAPTAGAQASAGSRIVASANAFDPDPEGQIERVEYYINGSYRSGSHKAPWESAIQLYSWDVGSVELIARAYEIGGAFSESLPITIQVGPDTPPTIESVSPSDNGTVVAGRAFKVQATITDNGPDLYAYFYVNGNYSGYRGAAPYEWLVIAPSEGNSLELRIEAYDVSWNLTSKTVRVTAVADQPPSVAITAPLPGSRFVSGAATTFVANASDDVGVSWVDFYLNGALLGRDAESPYVMGYTPTTQDAEQGSITVYALAIDAAGLISTSASMTYGVDPDAAPTVDLVEPASDRSIVAGDAVMLRAQASDDIGVEQVTFFSNGAVLGVDYQAPYEFRYVPTVPQLESIAALAVDTAGNTTWSSPITLTVKANEPPTVAITSPVDGAMVTQGRTIVVAADASDDSGVSYVEFYVDGSPVAVDASAPFTVEITTLDLGVHGLGARAYDKGGLAADSASVSVQVVADTGMALSGRVVDSEGAAVPNAWVMSSVGGSGQTAADGTFVLSAVSTTRGKVTVSARAVVNGRIESGYSVPIDPTEGANLDIGDIHLSPAASYRAVIDEDGEHPAFPSVAIDAAGNVHMVWVDHGAYFSSGHAIRTLYYQVRDVAGRIIVGKTLLVDDTNSPYKPTIVIDPQQRAHILWNAWTCGDTWCWGKGAIYHLALTLADHPKDGTPLDSARDVSVPVHPISEVNDYDHEWVNAAVDAAGGLHVVWRDAFYLGYDSVNDADARVQYMKLDASTGEPLLAERTLAVERNPASFSYSWLRTSPNLGVDNAGNVHVIWASGSVDDNGYYTGALKYLMLDGSTGTVRIAETPIASKYRGQFAPSSILVDETNRVLVGAALSYIDGLDWVQHPLYLRLNPGTAIQDGSAASAEVLNEITPIVLGPGRRNGGNYMPPAMARDASGDLHFVWLDNMWHAETAVNYQRIDAVTGTQAYPAPVVIGHSAGRLRDGDYYWNVGTALALDPQTGYGFAAWADAWQGEVTAFERDGASVTGVVRHAGDPSVLGNVVLTVRTSVGTQVAVTDGEGRITLSNLPLAAGSLQSITVLQEDAAVDWVATVNTKVNVDVVTDLGQIVLFARPRGVVGTVAGTGMAGHGVEGQPSTATALNSPEGVAIGPDGGLYVADTPNNRVLRIGADGMVARIAGTGADGFGGDGGLATEAQLSYPVSVTVRDDGSVYIADFGNNRVRRVGADGRIATVAGTGVLGFNGATGFATQTDIGQPYDVAFAADGTMYVSSFANSAIYAVKDDGTVHLVAGTGVSGGYAIDGTQAAQAQLNGVRGLAVGPEGSLYFAESWNNRIRRISPEGVLTTVAGLGSTRDEPSGDGGSATEATLSDPYDVIVGADGSLYVADTWHYRVRRVMPDGTIGTLVGTGARGYSGDGGDARQAKLSKAGGVAVSPDGQVYVADQDNHVIRRFDPAQ